jgi:hypothetical protein
LSTKGCNRVAPFAMWLTLMALSAANKLLTLALTRAP